MKKETDVVVRYYPETGKGHEIGLILFKNETDKLIEHERVELVLDGESLYFTHSHDGSGLRLNNGKIQLWTLAWMARDWQGEYPLTYDINKGCYKISRCDKQELESDPKYGSRLGEPVQYTPHKNEMPAKKIVNNSEKTILNVLLDKLIQHIDEDKLEPAKTMALAIKSLIND